MKLLRPLILAVGSLTCLTAQAGVGGGLTLTFDWNSISSSGVRMVPTTFIDTDLNLEVSSYTDVFIGYGEPFVGGGFPEIYQGSILKTYSDTEVNIAVGYNESTNKASASVQINNGGGSIRSGYAEFSRELFYQASSSGEVTFELGYSLVGSAAVEDKNDFEYINAAYAFEVKVSDETAYEQAFNDALALNGGDEDAAGDAAEAATLLAIVGDTENLIPVLENYNNCQAGDCILEIDEQGVISITFDVEKDQVYLFDAKGRAHSYSDVSAVPIPAAGWMFGSGLLGFAGLARRKLK